ncbi:MAG: hypothetical protein WKG07_29940 [Hymenobacter sp.]
MGAGLGIPDLPTSYPAWQADRARHLAADLAVSACTTRPLPPIQKAPGQRALRAAARGARPGSAGPRAPAAGAGPGAWLRPALLYYRATKNLALSQWLKNLLLPAEYAARIRALDAVPAEYARA